MESSDVNDEEEDELSTRRSPEEIPSVACRWCGDVSFANVSQHEPLCAFREVRCPTCRDMCVARMFYKHQCRPEVLKQNFLREHKTATCTLCGGMRLAATLEKHTQSLCSHRPVRCNYCHVTVLAKDYLSHTSDGVSCKGQLITCSRCEMKWSAVDYEIHVNAICPHCDHRFPQCTLKSHVAGCVSNILCPYCHVHYTMKEIEPHMQQCTYKETCCVCHLPLVDDNHECVTTCGMCGTDVPVIHMTKHKNTECRVKCECCGVSIHPKDRYVHCSEKVDCLVPCLLCHQRIPCVSRTSHASTSCPEREVQCPTCTKTMRWCVLQVHEKWCKEGRDEGILGIVLDPNCVVVDVKDGSPASEAGLRIGDRINHYRTHHYGLEQDVTNRRDIAFLMTVVREGDVIAITVLRGVESVTMDLILRAPKKKAPPSDTRLKTLQQMRITVLDATQRGNAVKTITRLLKDSNATDLIAVCTEEYEKHRTTHGGWVSMGDVKEIVENVLTALELGRIPFFTEEVQDAMWEAEWYTNYEESANIALTPRQLVSIVDKLLRNVQQALME
eukprot:PhF_6_TR40409/c0_g1_i1/m.60225